MKNKPHGARHSDKERFLARRDYDHYSYTREEILKYSTRALALYACADYLFYRNLWLLIPSVPFTFLFLKKQKEQLIKERRKRLNEQFRDALISLNVAVQAGYSIENAVTACIHDLRQLYPEGTDILEEFRYIENQLYISTPVEELFLDLAERTRIEDIETFAAVFYTAKRTGGDMSAIIQNVSRMLSDKIDVKKEIQATLAAKQYEQLIMSLMPAGILIYLRLSSPGFLDLLYGNLLGAVVMSVCLAVYGFAWWLGMRIVDISV